MWTRLFYVIMTTNISRIILSQSIKSLNLHEYAKIDEYEKELYYLGSYSFADAYRL